MPKSTRLELEDTLAALEDALLEPVCAAFVERCRQVSGTSTDKKTAEKSLRNALHAGNLWDGDEKKLTQTVKTLVYDAPRNEIEKLIKEGIGLYAKELLSESTEKATIKQIKPPSVDDVAKMLLLYQCRLLRPKAKILSNNTTSIEEITAFVETETMETQLVHSIISMFASDSDCVEFDDDNEKETKEEPPVDAETLAAEINALPKGDPKRSILKQKLKAVLSGSEKK